MRVYFGVFCFQVLSGTLAADMLSTTHLFCINPIGTVGINYYNLMKTLLLLLFISIAAMSCKKKSDPAPISNVKQKYLLIITPTGPYNSLTIKRDTSTVADAGNTSNNGGWSMLVDVYPENTIYYNYNGSNQVNLSIIKWTNGPTTGEYIYINQDITGEGSLSLSSLPR